MHACMHVLIRMLKYIYIDIYIHIHTHTYMYTHIHIIQLYTHTHTHTNIHTLTHIIGNLARGIIGKQSLINLGAMSFLLQVCRSLLPL